MQMIWTILFCLGIFWIWYATDTARRRREDTQQKANDKVIELRQRGIKAEVCTLCNGKGQSGAMLLECSKCGGIGYIYELNDVSK